MRQFISVLLLAIAAVAAQNPAITVNVDAAANQHPISPLIYGVNYEPQADLLGMHSPLNRYGGNRASTYNWQTDSDNHANDYYFESIGNSNPEVKSGLVDAIIQQSQAANAQPMVTIPMLDWIAKSGPDHPYPCSYPATVFPNQFSFDQFDLNCGDGLDLAQNKIPNTDPNYAYVANSTAIQQPWLQYLVGKWGLAANGGVPYYILDNEHSIWYDTHRDIHPAGPMMDEIRDKMKDFATLIKGEDASALVAGPEEYGYYGYFFSGYDQQLCNQGNCTSPDRAAHGGADYMPYLLQQFNNFEQQGGTRLLDVFTLHYYPQGGEYSNDPQQADVSPAMQVLRNTSTRALWDPNYQDPNTQLNIIRLIPQMQDWVKNNYPGTKIGITEYSWGAELHINGATAQADVLGIFGREGLDLATRWTSPLNGSPGYRAFQIYRNYDGDNSTFGDVSVQAAQQDADIDNVSAFAASRSSDGALTVMLVAKTLSATPVTVNVANFNLASPAQLWRLDSGNIVARLAPDITPAGQSLMLTLPPQSITLLVIPAAPQQAPPDFALGAPNPGAPSVAIGNPTNPIAVQVTATGAFQSPVTLSCPAPPAGITCFFMPRRTTSTVVYPTANAPATALVVLQTTSQAVTGMVNLQAVSAIGTSPQQQAINLTVTGGVGNPVDLGVGVNHLSSPDPTAVGQPLSFDLYSFNNGATPQTATVVLYFSSPVSFMSYPGNGCSGTGPVSCTYSIGPGASVLRFTVFAPFARNLSASASISSTASDSNPSDNTGSPSKAEVRPLPFVRPGIGLIIP